MPTRYSGIRRWSNEHFIVAKRPSWADYGQDMKITLDMDEDGARELLSLLEGQYDAHQSKANIIQAQIRQLQKHFGLDSISLVTSPIESDTTTSKPVKTPHG